MKKLNMKKTLMLFFFLPLFLMSQNNLVKWYNGKLTPSILENHISASNIRGNGNEIENLIWAADNIMYGYKAPSFSSTLSLKNYVQFTVTPDIGYKIENAVLQFTARVNSNSALMHVKYSTNADFSSSVVVKDEVKIYKNYTSFSFNIPTIISKAKTLYIRVYFYNTNDVVHLKHDVMGAIAPSLTGTVSLESPEVPIANDDRAAVVKNKNISVDILSNDEYRYSGALEAITLSQPLNGKVILNGLKDLVYIPNSDYVGYDHFYYTLTNSAGESKQAKVEVQVMDPGAVNQTPLVRWNKSNFEPKNYSFDIKGSVLKAEKEALTLINYGSSNNGSSFLLSDLAKPFWGDNTSGTMDPSKYLQISVQSTPDKMVYLNSFNMKFRGVGNGNITIKYSKTADFIGEVSTFENVNNVAYHNSWSDVVAEFPAGTVLFPNEILYLRIYTYNTNNDVIIDFLQDKEIGPAIFGFTNSYKAEPLPCKVTVVWTGKNWEGGRPGIDKKAVINADYSTLKHGSFSSCNLTVNSGKLTIATKYPVTVANEIIVKPAAFLEVQNDANLIQINDTAAANSGYISVLRDIEIGAARTQYNYLGSPVAFAPGESLKTIYPGISFALYHIESNNLFGASSGTNIPGRGLAVKEPTVAAVPASAKMVTAEFKGVPQNGVVSFPLANSNTKTNNSMGYNLLANPYPSNIDLKKLYKLNGGNDKEGKASEKIDATFYFWDNNVNNDIALTQQGSNYKGQAYAVFNAIAGKNGTGTSAAGFLNNNVIGKKIPASIIKVGQGFMTRALVKNYTFKFDNSIRTDKKADADFFGKGENQDAEDDRFWLKLVSPDNLTSTMAVVYFDGGNERLGPEDSQSRVGSDDIFSLIDGEKMVINGKNPFSASDKVLLGTMHFQAGNYTIAAAQLEGVFAHGQVIYLKDKQTGIVTNLSEREYTFATGAGEGSGRFEIIYQPETVLVTENKVKDHVVVYRDANDFVIASSTDKISDVEVYDAVGRLVYKVKPQQTKIVISADQFANGVYIVRIKQNETITSKKIIK